MFHVHESPIFGVISSRAIHHRSVISRRRSDTLSSLMITSKGLLYRRVFTVAYLGAETRSFGNVIGRVVDGVFPSKWIQFSLHEEVEEVAGGSIICQTAVEVDGPEKGMGLGSSWIGERNQIERTVTNYAFLVKNFTNWVANSLHVHVWQRLLREKGTRIYVLFCRKFVNWTDQSHVTVRLNEERNRRWCHLSWETGWSSFDDSTNSTKGG